MNFTVSARPRGAYSLPEVRARRHALSVERRRVRSLLVALVSGFALLGFGVDEAFREPMAGLSVIGFGTGVITIATSILINEPPTLAAGHRQSACPPPRLHGRSCPNEWGPPTLVVCPPQLPPVSAYTPDVTTTAAARLS